MNRKFWPIVVFVACWGAVLYGMFIPQPPANISQYGLDKGIHLVAFVAMTLSARLVLPGVPLVLFGGGMLVLAGGLEYLQPLVQPSRDFSPVDLGANVVGVLVGSALSTGCWRAALGRWLP